MIVLWGVILAVVIGTIFLWPARWKCLCVNCGRRIEYLEDHYLDSDGRLCERCGQIECDQEPDPRKWPVRMGWK